MASRNLSILPDAEKQIASRIITYFKRFPQGRRAPQEELEMAMAYAEILSELPTWAALKACDDAVRTGLGDGPCKFMPSCSELYSWAKKICGPLPGEKKPDEWLMTA